MLVVEKPMRSIGDNPIGTEAAPALRITRTYPRPRPRPMPARGPVVTREKLAHTYGLPPQAAPPPATPSAPAPPLRLVHPPDLTNPGPASRGHDPISANSPSAISHQPFHAAPLPPTDPRWVLAIRTAESLQGTLLTPTQRDRLIRLGTMMGLTPFDANLVIAIVQDRARRGHGGADCAAAGVAQLAMVPAPVRHGWFSGFTGAARWRTAYWLVTLLSLEVLVAWLLLT
jgi:hypothetical protein